MKKIILYNYRLSVYFSRGRKNLVKNGTWFLFSSELFYLFVSLTMIILSVIPIKVSAWGLLFILILISYVTFFYLKPGILMKINEIERTKNNSINGSCLIGLLLYFGSVFLFLIIGILTFEGYLIS
jgi:hypothetical protein